ncbi:hypothetical protein SCUCBS95973_008897 [Sporothrix curviconia]|uniref:Uncharacterized protein n=1 Tax=Sporothrix curviconia TaxID=1260050 RepID=A0ABP0CQG2_9PEZI
MAMNDTRQKPVRQWLEDIFTAGADAQVRRMLHLGPLLAHIEAEIKDMVQTLPALIQIDSAGGAPPQEQAKTVTSPATKLLLRAVERLVSDLSASASSNNSNNNSNNDNDKDENDDDNGIPPDLLPTIASIATGVEEDLAQVLPSAPSAPSAPAGYVGLEPFAQGNAQYAVAIAVLGWTTMLFSWVRADASPGLNGGLGVGIHGIGVGRVQTTSTPKRVNDLDLSADVRAFVDTYQCVPSTYDQGAHMENLLHASLLNYHSLFYIGGLKIEWVPRISEHLVLDTKAKTLRLFKYPSLCALARCGGSYQTATET